MSRLSARGMWEAVARGDLDRPEVQAWLTEHAARILTADKDVGQSRHAALIAALGLRGDVPDDHGGIEVVLQAYRMDAEGCDSRGQQRPSLNEYLCRMRHYCGKPTRNAGATSSAARDKRAGLADVTPHGLDAARKALARYIEALPGGDWKTEVIRLRDASPRAAGK